MHVLVFRRLLSRCRLRLELSDQNKGGVGSLGVVCPVGIIELLDRLLGVIDVDLELSAQEAICDLVHLKLGD